jgi:hypothetical protein
MPAPLQLKCCKEVDWLKKTMSCHELKHTFWQYLPAMAYPREERNEKERRKKFNRRPEGARFEVIGGERRRATRDEHLAPKYERSP